MSTTVPVTTLRLPSMSVWVQSAALKVHMALSGTPSPSVSVRLLALGQLGSESGGEKVIPPPIDRPLAKKRGNPVPKLGMVGAMPTSARSAVLATAAPTSAALEAERGVVLGPDESLQAPRPMVVASRAPVSRRDVFRIENLRLRRNGECAGSQRRGNLPSQRRESQHRGRTVTCNTLQGKGLRTVMQGSGQIAEARNITISQHLILSSLIPR